MRKEDNPDQPGMVLLAHGSQDPEAEAEMSGLCSRLSEAQPALKVAQAWLNREPSLAQAVAGLAASGCSTVRVFPLLVFQGRHTREDIPGLVAEERRKHPELRIDLRPHLIRASGFETWLTRALAGLGDSN